MKRIKTWIRFLFGFSRTETNGFIILLPLMFLILFSQPLYQYFFNTTNTLTENDIQLRDSIMADWKWNKQDTVEYRQPKIFRFNPNSVSENELHELGLNKYLTQKLINYRNSGGKFKVKGDLLKIYGMDTLWFKSRYVLIDLPEKIDLPSKVQNLTKISKSEKIQFDLNKADTTQLISVYGIGKKLATRIIKYRERLGGFVNMNQLSEVYGLDTLVIQKLEEKFFIDPKFIPVQLKINEHTEKELATHPYLNKEKAKAIAAYRFQHGAFASLDDLNHIKLLDEHTLQRLKPYCTLQ